MDIKEALEEVKKGKRIARSAWKEEHHIEMCGKEIHAFREYSGTFQYDMSILLSDDWVVKGKEDVLMHFTGALDELNKGNQLKLKDWEDKYIILDKISKEIILKQMGSFPFMLDYNSLIATDWEVVV